MAAEEEEEEAAGAAAGAASFGRARCCGRRSLLLLLLSRRALLLHLALGDPVCVVGAELLKARLRGLEVVAEAFVQGRHEELDEARLRVGNRDVAVHRRCKRAAHLAFLVSLHCAPLARERENGRAREREGECTHLLVELSRDALGPFEVHLGRLGRVRDIGALERNLEEQQTILGRVLVEPS